jgi:hypothetical protein
VAGVVAPDCHLSVGEAERATCFAKPALVRRGGVSGVFGFSMGSLAGSDIVVLGLSLQVRRDSVANEFIENTMNLRIVCSAV